jgi:hypothetical protein
MSSASASASGEASSTSGDASSTSGDAGVRRILAVGDVFLDRPAARARFDALRALLATGDVVFGNCEGVYSASAEQAPNARGPQIAHPDNARPLAELGFSVMSLANNHVVDGGHEGLRQTVRTLRGLGIGTVGAGEDLAAASSPATVTAGSVRVAFVAFSAVFPDGYEARTSIPGLAPLRAHTIYLNPAPGLWNPGAAPQTLTAIDDADSASAEEAVARARENADLVVASVHWGEVSRPHVLTDYEPQAAQLLADAGADLVIGHHQHTLRGVGFLGRVPVAYGLGHLACDLPRLAEQLRRETDTLPLDDEEACREALGDFGIYPRAGWPLLPFHPDSRRTAVARFDVGSAGVVSAGLYPCRIAPDGDVLPLRSDDPELKADLDHFREAQRHVPEAATVLEETDGDLAYWRLNP